MNEDQRKSEDEILFTILSKCLELFVQQIIRNFYLQRAKGNYIPPPLESHYNSSLNESRNGIAPVNNDFVINPNIPLAQRNTICPITGGVMQDPVYINGDSSGTRYEGSAIRQWLSRSNTNPITRQVCSSQDIRRDNQLRRRISRSNTPSYATSQRDRGLAPEVTSSVKSPVIALADRNTKCPITGDVIQDPVYINGDSSGTRYERSAIQEWLSRSDKNPITRQTCSTSDLRSDTELKEHLESKCEAPSLQESDKEPTQADDTRVAKVKDQNPSDQNPSDQNQGIARENFSKSREKTANIRKLSNDVKSTEQNAVQSGNNAQKLNEYADNAQQSAANDRKIAEEKSQAYQDALIAKSNGSDISDKKIDYLKNDAKKSSEYADKSSSRADKLVLEAGKASDQATADKNVAVQTKRDYHAEKSKYNTEHGSSGYETKATEKTASDSSTNVELSKVDNTKSNPTNTLQETSSVKSDQKHDKYSVKGRSDLSLSERGSNSSSSSRDRSSSESSSSRSSSSESSSSSSSSSESSSSSSPSSESSSSASSSSGGGSSASSSSSSASSSAPTPCSTTPKPYQGIARENFSKSREKTANIRKLSNDVKSTEQNAVQSGNNAQKLNEYADNAQQSAANDRKIAEEKSQAYQDALIAKSNGSDISDKKIDYLKNDAKKSSEYADKSSSRADKLVLEAGKASDQATADKNVAVQTKRDYHAEKSKYNTEHGSSGYETKATEKTASDSSTNVELSKVDNTKSNPTNTLQETSSLKSDQKHDKYSVKGRSDLSLSERGSNSSSSSSESSSSRSSSSESSSSSSSSSESSSSSSPSSESSSSASSSSGGGSSASSSSSSASSSAPTPCSTTPKPSS